MNPTQTLLRQLEAHVQEELGAHGRLIECLERQEQAMRVHDMVAILDSARAIDELTQLAAKRAARRDELTAQLARQWSVSGRALTLSSIVARAGDDGRRLARARDELEVLARKVQRLARRTSLAARCHERITHELLRTLFEAAGRTFDHGGNLVNAQA